MVLVDVMMGRMMVMVTVEEDEDEIESLDTSLAKVRRREESNGMRDEWGTSDHYDVTWARG
jgi:riboflavin synthase